MFVGKVQHTMGMETFFKHYKSECSVRKIKIVIFDINGDINLSERI